MKTTPADAPIQADTAVLRALRRIRSPQTLRNRELGLLIFACLISAAAIVLVQLGALGQVDVTILTYSGGLTLLALGLHGVLRFRAPNADPFVLPIATLLTLSLIHI